MADDLGMESLECFGGSSFKTPTMNRLARESMRFTRCYSQPICTPSRNKIMTGRSNARNYQSFGHMDRNEITFGTLMKEDGYKTAIAGKWQLTGGGGSTGTKDGDGSYADDCGFDETCMWAYARDVSEQQAEKYFSKYPAGQKRKMSRFWYPGILKNGEQMDTDEDDFGPDIYCDFLLEFIERNQKDPLFAYYPMALTHNPFVPMPITDGVDKLTLKQKLSNHQKHFPDMVRYTGQLIDRFLKKLEALGIAENTLVMFTSDNGNHRSLVYEMNGRTVIGGKGLPLDAGCHAVTMAWWKGKVKPGLTCEDLIDFSDFSDFSDFLPTFAEAGKAQLPSDRTIDGKSFLARLEGDSYTWKPYTPRLAIFVHYDKDPDSGEPDFYRTRFAFDGRHKLYLDGRMFDVPQDLEEQKPIDLKSASKEVKSIKARLQRVLDQMPNWELDNSHFNG